MNPLLLPPFLTDDALDLLPGEESRDYSSFLASSQMSTLSGTCLSIHGDCDPSSYQLQGSNGNFNFETDWEDYPSSPGGSDASSGGVDYFSDSHSFDESPAYMVVDAWSSGKSDTMWEAFKELLGELEGNCAEEEAHVGQPHGTKVLTQADESTESKESTQSAPDETAPKGGDPSSQHWSTEQSIGPSCIDPDDDAGLDLRPINQAAVGQIPDDDIVSAARDRMDHRDDTDSTEIGHQQGGAGDMTLPMVRDPSPHQKHGRSEPIGDEPKPDDEFVILGSPAPTPEVVFVSSRKRPASAEGRERKKLKIETCAAVIRQVGILVNDEMAWFRWGRSRCWKAEGKRGNIVKNCDDLAAEITSGRVMICPRGDDVPTLLEWTENSYFEGDDLGGRSLRISLAGMEEMIRSNGRGECIYAT